MGLLVHRVILVSQEPMEQQELLGFLEFLAGVESQAGLVLVDFQVQEFLDTQVLVDGVVQMELQAFLVILGILGLQELLDIQESPDGVV